MKTNCLWSFLLSLNLGALVQGAGQAEYYRLINDLFDDYKPEIRPTDSGGMSFVYLTFDLLSIQALEAKSQVLEIHASISLYWKDLFLSWDEESYGNISYFFYPQKKIWLPDIVCHNSVESQRQLGYDQLPCKIASSGIIFWNPHEIFKTGCSIDISYYPFDSQNCNIEFTTLQSTTKDIWIFQDPDTPVSLTSYNPSGTWDLIEANMYQVIHESNVTIIKINLEMKRLRTYYVLNIILPVLFLSFVASTVFFLPADAGEKMGMSMTVLLAFAVYLTIISDNMPQTSLQVSFLAVYLTLLLGFTTMGVLLSVIVLHLHHKPDDLPIGPKTTAWTRWARRIYRMSRSPLTRDNKVQPMDVRTTFTLQGENGNEMQASHSTNGKLGLPADDVAAFPEVKKRPLTVMTGRSSVDLDEEELTWQIVAETMDRIFFTAFGSLVLLVTFIMLPALALGD